MAASFYESLEEKSSRLFFLMGDGWMETAILYWANRANKGSVEIRLIAIKGYVLIGGRYRIGQIRANRLNWVF